MRAASKLARFCWDQGFEPEEGLVRWRAAGLDLRRDRNGRPVTDKRLGLDDDQLKQIARIHGEYGARVAELQNQVSRLNDERNAAAEQVLTAEQREKLSNLRADKAQI